MEKIFSLFDRIIFQKKSGNFNKLKINAIGSLEKLFSKTNLVSAEPQYIKAKVLVNIKNFTQLNI